MSATRELISAIETKNNVQVCQLVENMAISEINKSVDGETALGAASETFNDEALDLLLSKNGIDVNSRGAYGTTLLHKASSKNNVHAASKIITCPQVDVNAKDDGRLTPLHNACSYGNLQIVLELLKSPDIDVNAKNNIGSTPLHFAGVRNNHQIVSALLDRPDIDVNARDEAGMTAMMESATRHCKEVLKVFLGDPRVDLDIKDDRGRGLEMLVGILAREKAKTKDCLGMIKNERRKRSNRRVGQQQQPSQQQQQQQKQQQQQRAASQQQQQRGGVGVLRPGGLPAQQRGRIIAGQTTSVSPSKKNPLQITIPPKTDSPKKFLPTQPVVDTTNFLKSLGEPEPEVNRGAFLKSLGGASGGGDEGVNESVDQENSFLEMLNKLEPKAKTAVNTKENRGKPRGEVLASQSRTVVGQVDMSRTMMGEDLDLSEEEGDDSMVDTGGFLAASAAPSTNATVYDGGMDVTRALSMTCVNGGEESTPRQEFGELREARKHGLDTTGEKLVNGERGKMGQVAEGESAKSEVAMGENVKKDEEVKGEKVKTDEEALDDITIKELKSLNITKTFAETLLQTIVPMMNIWKKVLSDTDNSDKNLNVDEGIQENNETTMLIEKEDVPEYDVDEYVGCRTDTEELLYSKLKITEIPKVNVVDENNELASSVNANQIAGNMYLNLIKSNPKASEVADECQSLSTSESRQFSPSSGISSLSRNSESTLLGRVRSLAISEEGSKFLVSVMNQETVPTIQEELLSDALSVMMHPVASKVMQAVVEATEDLEDILEIVLDNFQILSSDKSGSRIIKHVLTRLPCTKKNSIVAKLEKEEILADLLSSQQGTNVAQACIPHMTETSVASIVKFVLGNLVELGNNPNGSYFIQLFVTSSNPSINKASKDSVLDAIVENVENLLKKSFGSCLLQTALKVSQSPRHIFLFSAWVKDNIKNVFCDPDAVHFASSVIEVLVNLSNSEEADLAAESEKILRDLIFLMTDTLVEVDDSTVPLLVAASFDPYGHVLAREVCLQARYVPEIRNKFIQIFSQFKSKLEDDTFGSLVLKGLQGLL